jgi:hypothetical protein
MFIVTAAHRCFCVFSIMPIFFSLPVLVAAAAAAVLAILDEVIYHRWVGKR